MIVRAEPSPGYQLFILALSVYALAVVGAQAVLPLGEETRRVLDAADYAVCALFLFDFLLSLRRAENRMRYFVTWGWLDLLSSIPAVDVARWGRIGRIVRVFRVLRALRATRVLAAAALRNRAQNTVLATALVAMLLVVFCSVAILQFETAPESNIRNAQDAMWWAVETITTAGYGDRYPVTPEGRLIATILMCAGIGLFGTLSGFLAAWFVAPAERREESELAALRAEIAALRATIENKQEIV